MGNQKTPDDANARVTPAERVQKRKLSREEKLKKLTEISDHAAALPVFDPRSPDEIIGYDENGLPS